MKAADEITEDQSRQVSFNLLFRNLKNFDKCFEFRCYSMLMTLTMNSLDHLDLTIIRM